MSYIVKTREGKFRVFVVIQDGTEDCGQYDTFEEAKKNFVDAENVLNHRKMTMKDVEDMGLVFETQLVHRWVVLSYAEGPWPEPSFANWPDLLKWIEDNYDSLTQTCHGVAVDELAVIKTETKSLEQKALKKLLKEEKPHLLKTRKDLEKRLEALKKEQLEIEAALGQGKNDDTLPAPPKKGRLRL